MNDNLLNDSSDHKSCQDYNEIIFPLEYIAGSLSIFGTSCIIIMCIIKISRNKFTSGLELTFYLSLISLLNAIAHMIKYIPDKRNFVNTDLCTIQAMLILSTELGEFFICTSIIVHLWVTVKHEKDQHTITICKRMIILGFSFGLPSLVSIVGLIFNIYGPSGKWCWIKPEMNFLRISVYATMWLTMVFDLILGIYVTKQKKDPAISEEEYKNRISYANQILKIPKICLFCWLLPFLNRSIREYTTCLIFGHVFSIQIQGFCFFLASASSFKYMKQIKKCFGKLKCKDNLNNSEFSNLSKHLIPNTNITEAESYKNSIIESKV